MTLLLNVTDAISRRSTHGITRVERKLALALAGRPDVQFVIMHGGRLWRIDEQAVLERLVRPSLHMEPRVERFGVDPPTATAPSASWPRSIKGSFGRRRNDTGLTLEPLDARRGDVLFSAGIDWTHGTLDEAERVAFASDASYVGFCYDLIPIDHPEWMFPSDPALFVRHFARMARIASSILCISRCTAADFSRHFPAYPSDRLPVLTLGSDAAIAVGPRESQFARSIFDGAPYAVYCATIDRRKNHQVLYRAAREMARRKIEGNLLFVGMVGSGVADLINAMRNDDLVRGRIAHVTQCDDEHLAALYKHARVAVYPSMYEGWGLGVTEALAHGKRSIVASGSSLFEASFGTAREVHPLVTAQWVDAISEHIHETDHLDVELPTWRETADQLVDLVSTR
jgi:glycosyltransferase involved in cell wall biosynthesis